MLRISPELARAQHRHGLADLRRQAAVERHDQQPARAVARLDEAARLTRVHHHRLFQQHVQPGGHGLLRLVVVQGVRGDDEDRVQVVRVIAEQRLQVRRVGRRRQPDIAEEFAEALVGVRRRLADDRDLHDILVAEHSSGVVARHSAAADNGDAKLGRRSGLAGWRHGVISSNGGRVNR